MVRSREGREERVGVVGGVPQKEGEKLQDTAGINHCPNEGTSKTTTSNMPHCVVHTAPSYQSQSSAASQVWHLLEWCHPHCGRGSYPSGLQPAQKEREQCPIRTVLGVCGHIVAIISWTPSQLNTTCHCRTLSVQP